MRIGIIGGGWYGCHIAAALMLEHDVQLFEREYRLFSGASGANPARLHLGFHYPRSRLTRAACQEQNAAFMKRYGAMTHAIPVNLYAIASDQSMVDFGNYVQTLRGELEFVTVDRPEDFGLQNVEGAILTGERHIMIRDVRDYFANLLGARAHCGRELEGSFDLTIDCTFCARDGLHIDRYEPCVTSLVQGPTDRALTIMDGPFPSLYPWDERDSMLSLTSAALTPLAKCKTYAEAKSILTSTKAPEIRARAELMREALARYWPASWDLFRPIDNMLSIRAMPASGADARLVDIVELGPREIRIRAGKIVSIFHAVDLVKAHICSR